MPDRLNGRLTPEGTMNGSLSNRGTLRGVLGGTGAVVTYASLPDKPSINGVTLVGNKTTRDLRVSYNDLEDKPAFPDVDEIEDRLDTLEGETASLDSRLTSAEGDITSLDSRLTSAEGNISSLAGRVTTNEGVISDLQGGMSDVQGDISEVQGDISDLETGLRAAEGNISSLAGRMTTAEGDISSLAGRVTTNEGNISSLAGRVTTNEGDISDLETGLGAAEGNITSLDGRLATAEGDITQLKASLNGFSTWKTWQPELYDYTTFKRNFSTSGEYRYLEIGSLVLAYINVNNQDYSGISTMLQIRNLPMVTVLSGICYFAGNATAGADKVVQMLGGTNHLYPRPNITSAYFSNPTSSGWTSILIFGAK